MTENAWDEESIFDAAIEIDGAAARGEFLDRACGGNTVLRRSVDELIRHFDQSGDFLETPVIVAPVDACHEQPGDQIGKYRLGELIGEGGFGAVYRAEQLEPVRRVVALKIVKLGMDTAQIISRFDAERQTLAIMNHPNIATVFDAGETQSGRPYFVMELVEGQPLDTYCDSNHLTIEERLRLFLGVCGAVQHAHHKGLVHRDLKPSNILVAQVDTGSLGIPKVIDFGIAKAIDDPVPPTVALACGELVGSPAYMSPEQVLRTVDIDIRSDIYSLGGVLYKLLVGVSPLDEVTTNELDFDRLCHAICDSKPLPPSVRLTEMGEQTVSRLAEIAANRRTKSEDLQRELREDLDWIVAKALAKDRTERYDTASELAGDIERFLKNEPVLAAPADRWYRLRKFVTRNRLPVVAAALILLAIVAGSAAATVGFVRAELARRHADDLRVQAEYQHRLADEQRRLADEQRRLADAERERAVAEATKALQVVGLLEQLLGAAHPEHGHPADYTVRQLLQDSAESMLESLSAQPEVEATLRRTIGRAYWHLGEMPRAGPHLERALELRRATFGANHSQVIASQVDWAMYLIVVSRFDEALETVNDSLAALRTAGATDEHALALLVLSRIHDAHARYSEAETCMRNALQMSREVHGERHPSTLWIQSFHLYSLMQLRDREAAEPLARKTISLQTEVLGAEHAHVAFTQSLLALVLLDRGALDEAESLARRALETHRKLLGPQSSDVARDLLALSAIERDRRRPIEAERLAREAVAIAENSDIDRAFLRLRAYRTLAAALRFRDRDQSVAYLQKTIELQRSIMPTSHVLCDMLYRQGDVLRELGKLTESQACYREGIEIQRHNPNLESNLELHVYGLANTFRQMGRLDDAEPLLREAAEASQPKQLERPILWLDWLETLVWLKKTDQAAEVAKRLDAFAREWPTPVNKATVPMAEALVLLAQGKPDEVESKLQAAAHHLRNNRIARADLRMGGIRAESLIQQGKYDEAERILLELEKKSRTRNPFQADDTLFVDQRLIQLYDAWEKPAEAARWRERMLGK